jgi:hypothetical protein
MYGGFIMMFLSILELLKIFYEAVFFEQITKYAVKDDKGNVMTDLSLDHKGMAFVLLLAATASILKIHLAYRLIQISKPAI